MTTLLDEVADYYTSRLVEHGATPRGVDWNGEAGQTLRFEQLCRIVEPGTPYSVNDLGCGYGALLDHLDARDRDVTYTGIDVSAEMVRAASERHAGRSGVRFVCASRPDQDADYGMASGIFNVRLNRSNDEWWTYFEATLDALAETSRKGFAFNCLTSYSDVDKMRDYLYYADPCRVFDLCKRRYSRNVALLHDYGLYEFTIVVRKAS
ncbi:methyltransferase [Rhodopseudomonas palustris]|uniref:class I SAM-dependent methyltransferase n=1 Tax=Rhodopseudomonas palustris TaxID=1076 RepID=UPI0021F37E4D|nr:class I SAM-dependent methyltransferase [Rhodopseudomonas palustris]UYO44983.1 methyltransferase [Rhodopseudomonas palustris]